jgi:hypothetical protein
MVHEGGDGKPCKGKSCKNPKGRDAFAAAVQEAKKMRARDPSIPYRVAVSRAYCSLHGETKRCKQLKAQAASSAPKAKTKKKPATKGKECPRGHKVCTCDSK